MQTDTDIVIIGAGIAGLTLALELNRIGIRCRVLESTPTLRPLGVGVNLLPHATVHLERLGVLPALQSTAVDIRESVFFNRFGQLVYREPAGRFAGNAGPQLSIHRGHLQQILAASVQARLGDTAIATGHRVLSVDNSDQGVTVHSCDPAGQVLPPVRGRLAIACDGIHSAIRRQLHPQEGEPVYRGVQMWRGTTVFPPFLGGASMVRAGWLSVGKLVLYPIRNNVDRRGGQLINWVVELNAERPQERDWSRTGLLSDFLPVFENWVFDWLDVPALLRGSALVLEFPMVDQDPLDSWTLGRTALLGDAAHPMVPRGSNGAGQAIVDCAVLAACLARHGLSESALRDYESQRLPITRDIILANRSQPPDAILREVHERTGDTPFARIEDVISHDEMAGIADAYRAITARAVADPTHYAGSAGLGSSERPT